jgi:hypothetical protein
LLFTDDETRQALNALVAVAKNQDRSIVLWIGAGVSVWANYPLWQVLAAEMHSIYSREVPKYDRTANLQLLNQGNYPDLFEKMREGDRGRYFRLLAERFGPEHISGVYRRFLAILGRLANVSIVTTNVDETLERNLPEYVAVQHSDIERVPNLLHGKTEFICKLHGSVSSVETMVFSTSDYQTIQRPECLDALAAIFANSTVLFIGYGLRDEYVLQILRKSSAERPLFGVGPHFTITPEDPIDLPPEIRKIRYAPEVADHRDSLQILEALVGQAEPAPIREEPSTLLEANAMGSVYYIADIMPPGTWTTSQNVMIQAPSEASAREMIVGDGYVVGEVALDDYSALHDVIVGLICFDTVCLSIEHLDRIHSLLGSEAFWLYVRGKCLRVVVPPAEPVVVFLEPQSTVGSLAAVHLGSAERKSEPVMSIAERIRRQVHPAPGKEKEAEELFQLLESTALNGAGTDSSELLPHKTIAALMNPSIRQLLGLSGGTPTGAIPRWLAFPVLRLSRVIRSGLICQAIQATSTRMIWGSEKLASVAFSASATTEWAESAASYVLSGRFNSNLGQFVQQQPAILLEILNFRDSLPGQALRKEVAEGLAANDGQQIAVTINSALQRAIPISVLEKARDQLSGLFTRRAGVSALSPAVWGDLRNSDARIAGWRKRSLAALADEIIRRKLGPYDSCPCGSGERLKFCCQQALK